MKIYKLFYNTIEILLVWYNKPECASEYFIEDTLL